MIGFTRKAALAGSVAALLFVNCGYDGGESPVTRSNSLDAVAAPGSGVTAKASFSDLKATSLDLDADARSCAALTCVDKSTRPASIYSDSFLLRYLANKFCPCKTPCCCVASDRFGRNRAPRSSAGR